MRSDFRVLEAVPLGRGRAQGFGEDDEAGELDGNFAGLGGEEGAGDADEIRQVQVLENVELLVAEDVFLGVDLDAAALVANVDEHGLAHVAVGGDAAGERDFTALDIISARGGAGFRGGKLVAEGENTLRLQGFELGFALFDQ